jgi:cysteine desulfuration protein SufE
MTLDNILADMELFDTWEDRYAYLIDLGRKLPPFPEEHRLPEHKVKGCTSQVWMVHTWQGGKLHLSADSDAMIVKGLLAVLLAGYNGKTAEEVQAVPIEDAFKQMGLDQHLTINRRNGFTAMVGRIRAFSPSD